MRKKCREEKTEKLCHVAFSKEEFLTWFHGSLGGDFRKQTERLGRVRWDKEGNPIKGVLLTR